MGQKNSLQSVTYYGEQSFNDKTIANIASIISEYFSSKHALNILDLCCGSGEPTFKLLKALESKEVQVNEIVGYDISPEQVEIANSRYGDKKLKFKVQDIEKMKDEDSYHVVISLFGLHWINNVSKVAHKIHQASKTSALVYFFMPLEKMDLFHIRSKSIKKYSDFFGDYSIEPFIEKSSSYTKAFKNYFSLSDRRFSGMREMVYTEKQFKQFLLSWLPEVRYLKKNTKDEERYIIEEYLKRLIELLPENEGIKAIEEIENDSISNMCAEMNFEDDIFISKFRGEDSIYKIKFTERFFCFAGYKKALELIPDSVLSELVVKQTQEFIAI